MFEILGGCLAFWGIYALVAVMSKHQIGLIVTGILGTGAGIADLIARGVLHINKYYSYFIFDSLNSTYTSKK